MAPRLPVDPHAFDDPDVGWRWAEERSLTVFTMLDPREPLLDVDLLAEPPLPFEELWEQATVVQLGRQPVRIASMDHLITTKKAAAGLRTWPTSPPSRLSVAEPVEQNLPWNVESQELDRRQRWSSTTPSERLRWLERAIRFAGAAGALPRRRE